MKEFLIRSGVKSQMCDAIDTFLKTVDSAQGIENEAKRKSKMDEALDEVIEARVQTARVEGSQRDLCKSICCCLWRETQCRNHRKAPQRVGWWNRKVCRSNGGIPQRTQVVVQWLVVGVTYPVKVREIVNEGEAASRRSRSRIAWSATPGASCGASKSCPRFNRPSPLRTPRSYN